MDDGEIGTDDVLADVVEFGVRQSVAGQAKLDDRHIGGAVAQHQRRRNPRGQIFQNHQGAAGQLRDGAADIGAVLEIDFFDADPLVGSRLNARNVIDQGRQRPLVQRENAVLDILGAHPVIGPDDTDHRNVDFRKDVHRHAQGGADTQQTNENQA